MDQHKHFSHIHGLILHQVPQGSDIICSGCNFPGTGSVYVCWQCRFFLHEYCFNASRSMNHPSHPTHPLNLFPYPTYPSNSFYCNSCSLVGTGFSYSCSNCEFDLHVHCTYLTVTNILEPPRAVSLPKETPGFDPPEHAYMPQIATTNIHEPSPYYPNLSHSGPNEMPNSDPQHVYRPQIDPIPNETKSFSPQEHDRPQTYTIPNETTSFTAPQPHVYLPQTDPIPNETKHFSPQQHAYMPKTDPTLNEPPSFNPQHVYMPQTATHNDPNLSYPPKNDTVPSFSTPPKGYPTSEAFLSNMGTNPTKTQGTKLFSHSHPLYLSEVAEEDYITCSGCEQAISGSSYSCKNSECNFYLHKTCFELIQEIRHKSHSNHPLTLLSSPPYKDYEFTCNACVEIGTAFTYHCSTCKFDLHVTCASLPETVKRNDHEHALVLLYTSPITEQMREEDPDISLGCDVCKRGVEEGCWVYNCKLCNYGTHLSCVNSEEISEEVALADAVFNAQASMQRLQIQLQMSQQSAQFAISCAHSLSNLAG